jgi:hypothetical protein
MHYYARMRDIEVAAFHLNHLDLGEETVSAPRTDWYWGYAGRGPDRRSDQPERRSPENVRRMLVRAPWMGHVVLPHAVAVLLGLALFIGAVADAPGLEQLQP